MNDTDRTLETMETEMGNIRVNGLNLGGEELLDEVEIKLGVACRHIDKIRKGILDLSFGVEGEINRSILSARLLILDHE